MSLVMNTELHQFSGREKMSFPCSAACNSFAQTCRFNQKLFLSGQELLNCIFFRLKTPMWIRRLHCCSTFAPHVSSSKVLFFFPEGKHFFFFVLEILKCSISADWQGKGQNDMGCHRRGDANSKGLIRFLCCFSRTVRRDRQEEIFPTNEEKTSLTKPKSD